MSFNRVILEGNVGQVEVRTLSSTKVANISLATSERYTDRSGNRIENTSWHSLVAYGSQCDTIEKYVTKGTPMLIEGALGYREFTNKEGQKVRVAEVKVLTFQLLGHRRDDAAPADARGAAPANEGADDLPF